MRALAGDSTITTGVPSCFLAIAFAVGPRRLVRGGGNQLSRISAPGTQVGPLNRVFAGPGHSLLFCLAVAAPVRAQLPHNRYVHAPTGDVVLTELDRFPKPGIAEFSGGLYAPMPGKVLATEVSAGESVSEGQLLVILEAMKMEHRITAPIDGVVQEVPVSEGDQVDNGQILVVFEENEEES